MLNLRQLNNADNTHTNSDVQHFSQFSLEFRSPSDLLGNIGEPLDHSQSERLHEDELYNREAAEAVAEERPSGTEDLESVRPVAGPFGALSEDEGRVHLGIAGPSAGPSPRTGWGDVKSIRVAPEEPSDGPSETRGEEVVDGPSTSCVNGADPRTAGAHRQVRVLFCLWRYSFES